ncbi:helix-turn-helix domain-containing protein [Agrococcus casei]|uniref:helix-turn-helix domain-containing protein n=1 Tax=Agrococcus casei TaxID=343512 RepID=UPI003F92873B
MPENISDLSRAVSDVLTGEYAKKRLTQDELATRTEMSVWTLQKKLRGRSPVSATDLVVIAQAIGVDPAEVLTEAMADAGLTPNAEVSEVPASLDAHRKNRTPADMPEAEWEGLSSAANTDPEIGLDEPEQP